MRRCSKESGMRKGSCFGVFLVSCCFLGVFYMYAAPWGKDMFACFCVFAAHACRFLCLGEILHEVSFYRGGDFFSGGLKWY